MIGLSNNDVISLRSLRPVTFRALRWMETPLNTSCLYGHRVLAGPLPLPDWVQVIVGLAYSTVAGLFSRSAANCSLLCEIPYCLLSQSIQKVYTKITVKNNNATKNIIVSCQLFMDAFTLTLYYLIFGLLEAR